MSTLQALPDEILLRIIDEVSASGFGHSNPVCSLILVSQFFHTLSLPYLYRSVTISTFRQLVRYLSKDGSRAWDFGPNAGIRALWINAAYIDERFLFMPRNQRRSIQRDLVALVKQSPLGYLDNLHLRVVPLDVGLWEESPTPCDFFGLFFSIQARHIECTTANALPAYAACLAFQPFSVGDGGLHAQDSLIRLRIPFLWFGGESKARLHLFCQQHKLKKLHLDWPLLLRDSDVADMLIRLQGTLEDKGLVIDAPPSETPSSSELPQYLAFRFYQKNLDLSAQGIRNELVKRQTDVDALMKKLDMRVLDLDPASDVQFPDTPPPMNETPNTPPMPMNEE